MVSMGAVVTCGADGVVSDFPQPANSAVKEIIAKIRIVFRAIIRVVLTAREERAAQIELRNLTEGKEGNEETQTKQKQQKREFLQEKAEVAEQPPLKLRLAKGGKWFYTNYAN
jgi:hypothetical protein